MASNHILHAHTKHIERIIIFFGERVLHGDLRIMFLSTKDQIADIFTKGLSSIRFKFLGDKLIVSPCSLSNLKGHVNVSDQSEKSRDPEKSDGSVDQNRFGQLIENLDPIFLDPCILYIAKIAILIYLV